MDDPKPGFSIRIEQVSGFSDTRNRSGAQTKGFTPFFSSKEAFQVWERAFEIWKCETHNFDPVFGFFFQGIRLPGAVTLDWLDGIPKFQKKTRVIWITSFQWAIRIKNPISRSKVRLSFFFTPIKKWNLISGDISFN